MRVSLLALAATIASVEAFSNTSPFFYFSTAGSVKSQLPLQSAASLSSALTPELSKCATDFYILVHQTGVRRSDYYGSSSPSLSRAVRSALAEGETVSRSAYVVNELVGELDIESLRSLLEQKCEAAAMKVDASTGSFPLISDSKPRVIELSFPSPGEEPPRSAQLLEHDSFLFSLISSLPSESYTLLYSTIPAETSYISSSRSNPSSFESKHHYYEMDPSPQDSFNMELKRDLSPHGLISARAENSNITLVDGPLFERYGYLSPAIFMGLLAGVIFLSILYAGISGIAGLQVSYAAFDKETGPKAHAPKSQ